MPKHEYGLKLCVTRDTDENGYYRVTPSKWKENITMKFRTMSRMFLSPEDGQGGGAPAGGTQQQSQTPPANQQTNNQQSQPPVIDYDKIQQMLNGTLEAKENTALKAYFKQQGLSQEEAEQAMTAFKEQKAKNTPDIAGIQTQLTQAQELAQKEAVEKAAVLEAVGLGLDVKTIPYVLKMADLSAVTGQDGKINTETLKSAINKVLEDIPQLKPAQESQRGFQIGGGGNQQQQTSQIDQLASIFGNKK